MDFNDELDADRPFLEQFEDAAFIDDEVMNWLDERIYGNAEVMGMLSGCRIASDSGDIQNDDQEPGNVVAENQQIWKSVIPAAYWPSLENRQVVKAGFGAGPACMAQHNEQFAPPISLDQGIIWLERWRNTFKRARLILDDGSKLRFDPHGFVDYVSGVRHD